MSERLKNLREKQRQLLKEQELRKRAHSLEIPKDPDEFCKKLLGFTPTSYQEKVLIDLSQFMVLRWSRQSGKTWIISALLCWFAANHPNAWIGIVAPSFKASKRVILKITPFAQKLQKLGLVDRILKSIIYFQNGTRIEAFANNPDTIRGPTLDVIYWDEVGFTPDDDELYTAILFTLGTTNGRFLGSSTPGTTESVFYKMCFDDAFKDFSRHHVSWKDALEPKGPLKKSVLEKIRTQLRSDPWKWQREMEAIFAEDETRWLSLKLITDCISKDPASEYHDFKKTYTGNFYIGVDFAKYRDYTVVAVIDKVEDLLRLVYCHQFEHRTEYAEVIGYVKALTDRWKTVKAVYPDPTAVGDYIVEEMKKSIPVTADRKTTLFTVDRKQDMAQTLRSVMVSSRFEFPYDADLIEELHGQQFKVMKSGKYTFLHPSGSHDDRFWAVALAVFAAEKEPGPSPIVARTFD